MGKAAAVLLTALLLAAPAAAQKVTLPSKLDAQPGGPPIPLVATADGGNVVWFSPDPGLTVIDGGFFGGDSKKALLFAPNAGRYRVWAVTALKDKVSERAECIVTVGTPPEPPPVPPGPTPPGPTPPGPGPAPTPAAGLRVLMVYESADVSALPAAQQAVLYSKSVRDYLRAKCAAEPGGWKAFRIYDKDVDLAAESAEWKALMSRPRKQVPWVVIADGPKVLYEGALPATVDEALALLKKYGG
jgi:hypothetical protein